MSIASKCDRCGELFEDDDEYSPLRYAAAVMLIRYRDAEPAHRAIPREPTAQMLIAANDYMVEKGADRWSWTGLWKAMYAAAPPASALQEPSEFGPVTTAELGEPDKLPASADAPIPANCQRIGDYIAELERDPEQAKAIAEARVEMREWIAEIKAAPAPDDQPASTLASVTRRPSQEGGSGPDADPNALIARLKKRRQKQSVPGQPFMSEYVPDDDCTEAAAALVSLQEQIARQQYVIEWALGEHDTFPDWPATVTITGNPKYWWRKELRKRYDAAMGRKTEGAQNA